MPPSVFNIAPSEDTFITSGLTQKSVEDEDISLLGGAPLALDPARDDISLLRNDTSLIVNYIYPTEGASLGASTATDPTRASK